MNAFRKAAKIVAPILFAVVVVAGFAFWWFVLRGSAPPPASLVQRTTVAGSAASPNDSSADGRWRIQTGPDVFAGYRIQELFGGDTFKKTAVGRSPAVAGALSIDGSTVSAANIDVDVTKLKSDAVQRDNRIKSQGLQTDQFPTATFVLTKPVVLPSPPAVGTPVNLQATGNLTMHGVTRPATFNLMARWNGDTIDVAGSTPIVLADYGMTAPSVGNFVSVDDHGTVELQLTFVRG
jgi:polyisoprenoid-binding protein YceI